MRWSCVHWRLADVWARSEGSCHILPRIVLEAGVRVLDVLTRSLRGGRGLGCSIYQIRQIHVFKTLSASVKAHRNMQMQKQSSKRPQITKYFDDKAIAHFACHARSGVVGPEDKNSCCMMMNE